MPRRIQTIPVRVTVDVFRVFPRHPRISEEPIVVIQGAIDLSPYAEKLTLPMWFDAELQIWTDGTFELLQFEPTYGTIQGSDDVRAQLVNIYQHGLLSALLESKLKILGVRP